MKFNRKKRKKQKISKYLLLTENSEDFFTFCNMLIYNIFQIILKQTLDIIAEDIFPPRRGAIAIEIICTCVVLKKVD